ncbi:hypothetical protein ET445_04580 [Agromyces protaetiae]|uniref:SbsA Ig-like domain-containing protein n=1 Tax=Agromyces protaetiae TaxID=2509455 RepID=A0A4P6FA98_9MICO|nr:hypothetical protein [Agromyces protaetiae]QAY72724.1 hypothetical protein ET445_04580 [Agromyces protaetiae]
MSTDPDGWDDGGGWGDPREPVDRRERDVLRATRRTRGSGTMSPDTPTGPPTDVRRFRIGLVATIGVLAAASAALGFASLAQGPKLVDAAVDVQRVTAVAGSRVVLQLNQRVDRVDGEVHISPDEPASLTVDGDRLVVEFARPLAYDEDVTVTVDGVVGVAQPAPSTISYAFTTADEPIYTLVRRSPSGEPDVIQRSTTTEPEPTEVLDAPRLQSFAHAGDVVVAVAVEDDDTNSLRVAGIGDDVQTVGLPEPGVVRDIGGSTTHPLIAFTFTGRAVPGASEPTYRNALFTLDVSGQNAAPEPVLGADGAPLEVSSWIFVPGTTSLVVRDVDGALFVVDALGLAPPAPLGAHSELRGILPGTTTLVVADPDRGTLIDLATGEGSDNVLPRAELPDEAYPGKVRQLDADGTHVLEVLLTVDDGAGGVAARSLLARVDAAGTAVRYATGDGSRLLDWCVSPNGRLMSVETAAVGSLADGYPHDPSLVDRLTTVVDLADGRVVRVQNGGSSDWCG